MQQKLEALASTQRAPHQPAAREPDQPSYATVVSAEKPAGWDPREVWLDRIKRPRDQRRRP
jgi:hypothetical protein